jgi:hypothetical protein
MAKKKKAPEKEFLYRLKSQYQRVQSHKNWLECTLEAKNKIEKMYPSTYDFKLKAPPAPTPNMIPEEPSEKEKSE